MRKRQSKANSNPNDYFTKDHEQAIIDYVNTQDKVQRTHLYIEYIEPAFNEMVDKIVFTYKFTTLPNVDNLRQECKIWLITILDKYDPNSGSKAFSYFSVITKNWFIHKVKKTSEQTKREIDYENIVNACEHENLIVHNGYIQQRENNEFWVAFWKEIESWDQLDLKPNEKKVVEAIKIIMKEPDEIEIFNKKAIYLYLREITGLNTKQIVNNLNRIRTRYKVFKFDWDENNINGD
jgi:DNA-directed RNA polymerase specialized sigma subunit